jgi:hypothetical protein
MSSYAVEQTQSQSFAVGPLFDALLLVMAVTPSMRFVDELRA